MRKDEKIRRKVNDDFRDRLAKDFAKKFRAQIKSEWVFLAGRLVTTRKDDRKFTTEQRRWLAAYEAGYDAASESLNEATS